MSCPVKGGAGVSRRGCPESFFDGLSSLSFLLCLCLVPVLLLRSLQIFRFMHGVNFPYNPVGIELQGLDAFLPLYERSKAQTSPLSPCLSFLVQKTHLHLYYALFSKSQGRVFQERVSAPSCPLLRGDMSRGGRRRGGRKTLQEDVSASAVLSSFFVRAGGTSLVVVLRCTTPGESRCLLVLASCHRT